VWTLQPEAEEDLIRVLGGPILLFGRRRSIPFGNQEFQSWALSLDKRKKGKRVRFSCTARGQSKSLESAHGEAIPRREKSSSISKKRKVEIFPSRNQRVSTGSN